MGAAVLVMSWQRARLIQAEAPGNGKGEAKALYVLCREIVELLLSHNARAGTPKNGRDSTLN
jgi:uncharacterized circularly permuted ATP-grasp superfamily protein